MDTQARMARADKHIGRAEVLLSKADALAEQGAVRGSRNDTSIRQLTFLAEEYMRLADVHLHAVEVRLL